MGLWSRRRARRSLVGSACFFLATEVLLPAFGLLMDLPKDGAKIFSSDR
jgi:hypothetical protein